MKKFFKIIICDAVMIAVALIITFIGKSKAEKTSDERIFVPIIMYHSIVEDNLAGGGYKIGITDVENDLAYLKNHGYTSIFIEDIVQYVKNNKPLPSNPVVITADDGFYNNYCYLLPLLEKYDMKATVSVVGYFSEVLAENDSHIPEYSYLTWEDIRAMKNSGRIEIGNHTYNMHSFKLRKGCGKLSSESEEEYAGILTEDIGLLQTLLEINTGTAPEVFTYPYGYISPESIPLIKKLGFSAALNCYEKPNYITHDEECLFTLNRYNRPCDISTEEFMNKLLSQ